MLSLYDFFSYYDQHCFALSLREATMLFDGMIQSLLPHRHSSTQLITAFFTPLSPLHGLKRPSSSTRSTRHSRCVRSQTRYLHKRHSSMSGHRQSRAFTLRHAYHLVTDFFSRLERTPSLSLSWPSL